MIYFTNSYNNHRQLDEALKHNLDFRGVYVNKIHLLGWNENNVFDVFSKNNLDIIYDSPMYISSNFNSTSNKDVIDRKLKNEILNSENNFSYISDQKKLIQDVINCWKSYLNNIPDYKLIKKCLSLPSWYGINDENWNLLIENIPKSNYDYISFALDVNDFKDNEYKRIIKFVKRIMSKNNIRKILFCIKADYDVSVLDDELVKNIEEELSNLNTDEIIIHHTDWIMAQLKKKYSFSFGVDNQTKTLYKTQRPFIEKSSGEKQRAKSLFVADLVTNFAIDKTISYLEIQVESSDEDAYKYLKKIMNPLKLPKINGSDEIIANFKEWDRFLGLSKEMKKSIIINAQNALDAMSLSHQKMIIYSNDIRRLKTP